MSVTSVYLASRFKTSTLFCRFSWIHVDDLVNLLCEALSNPSYKGRWFLTYSYVHFHRLINITELFIAMIINYIYNELLSFTTGVINGTAPNPVRLAEMCEQLGSVLGRPSWLPVPDVAVKALLGEGATVVYLLFLETFCYLPRLSLYIHTLHSLHSYGGSTSPTC